MQRYWCTCLDAIEATFIASAPRCGASSHEYVKHSKDQQNSCASTAHRCCGPVLPATRAADWQGVRLVGTLNGSLQEHLPGHNDGVFFFGCSTGQCEVLGLGPPPKRSCWAIVQVVLTNPRRMGLGHEGSYVLTGGMGALGLVTAQVLIALT
eukprot:4632405-Amphidinium_carterae.2